MVAKVLTKEEAGGGGMRPPAPARPPTLREFLKGLKGNDRAVGTHYLYVDRRAKLAGLRAYLSEARERLAELKLKLGRARSTKSKARLRAGIRRESKAVKSLTRSRNSAYRSVSRTKRIRDVSLKSANKRTRLRFVIMTSRSSPEGVYPGAGSADGVVPLRIMASKTHSQNTNVYEGSLFVAREAALADVREGFEIMRNEGDYLVYVAGRFEGHVRHVALYGKSFRPMTQP